jgi:hypothetical protein
MPAEKSALAARRLRAQREDERRLKAVRSIAQLGVILNAGDLS